MNNLLTEIIANKKIEITAARKAVPEEALYEKIRNSIPTRDFANALKAPGTRIIAECKKQSPSKGVMKSDYDPVGLAQSYAAGGAAAISVLTDHKYFGGSLNDLHQVKASVTIPVLRKDFIVERYQIIEARAAGADSFLLIAGTMLYSDLFKLIEFGQSLGMEPLIESHTGEEFTRAIEGPGKIFGINNRNLSTFAVDFNNAASLISLSLEKRPNITMVCESGVHSRKDVENMSAVGYNVFLIGEALVTSPDPEASIRSLISKM